MSYANQDDLQLAFGEQELIQSSWQGHLEEGEEIPDEPNVAVIAAALENAAALIDSYIGPCIELPLSSVPPALLQVHMDITRYLLNEDRPSDEVKGRYDNALKYLQELCGAGPALVQPDGSLVPPNEAAAVSSVYSRPRIYTEALWATYDL